LKTAAWSAFVFGILLLIGILLIYLCTRTFNKMSTFVYEAGKVAIAKHEQNGERIEQIKQLYEQWEHFLGMKKTKEQLQNEQDVDEHQHSGPISSWCCCNLCFARHDDETEHRYSNFEEIHVLQKSIGYMLKSLQSSYEQLKQEADAKRQFIRYIFHEVRVPMVNEKNIIKVQ
jgi:hypothetical protein